MRPPVIVPLLCLVLSLGFAAASAADPRLDEMSEALSRELDARVEAATGSIVEAALERQTQQLVSLHQAEPSVAADASRMSCASAADGMLQCVLVAKRPARSKGLAAALR